MIDVLSFDKKPRKRHWKQWKAFKNVRLIILTSKTLVIGKGFDSNSMGGKKEIELKILCQVVFSFTLWNGDSVHLMDH